MVVPEIVREIIANIAAGSTLYRETKRLNDLGLLSPGSKYKGRPRKHGRSWPHTTYKGHRPPAGLLGRPHGQAERRRGRSFASGARGPGHNLPRPTEASPSRTRREQALRWRQEGAELPPARPRVVLPLRHDLRRHLHVPAGHRQTLFLLQLP